MFKLVNPFLYAYSLSTVISLIQEKKLTKLMNLLDKIIFKQAIIFVNKIDRAIKLA